MRRLGLFSGIQKDGSFYAAFKLHAKRQDDAGYIEVNTPDVMDRSLWETSGHWFNYRENMFITQTEDERIFALKPMNCQAQFQYTLRDSKATGIYQFEWLN